MENKPIRNISVFCKNGHWVTETNDENHFDANLLFACEICGETHLRAIIDWSKENPVVPNEPKELKDGIPIYDVSKLFALPLSEVYLEIDLKDLPEDVKHFQGKF
jgi:hypothetical protein